MSTSTADRIRIAQRYSNALFSLAKEKKQLSAVEKDMQALAAALSGSDALEKALINPVASRANKAAAIDAVLAKLKANKLTRDFFRVLAENRRLDTTAWVIRQFGELLREDRGEVRANVTTAHKLSADQIKLLEGAIKKATGYKQVDIQTHENPEILGGVIVNVGGKMFDNSVATKIRNLASSMKHEVQVRSS